MSRCGPWWALAACLVLGACGGRVQGSTRNELEPDPETQSIDSADAAPGILRAMVDAPFRTAYGGTRRVDYFLEVDGQTQALAYREDVLADGSGAFSVHATEMLSAHRQSDMFLMLQNVRQGFVYRMRDFHVRNLRLFRDNYTVEVLGNGSVAGVDCVLLLVERRTLPDGDTLLHVDPDSGLVLRWEDRAEDGLIRGRMEFESFNRSPDLSGVQLTHGRYDARAVDLDSAVESEVGFEILRPTLPPTGYQLEESGVLVDDFGDEWVRSYYTDGAQRVAFMNRGPAFSLPFAAGSGAGFDSIPAEGRGAVSVSHLGPWAIVTGSVGGHSVVVMGRVPADELLLMLQSAL